MLNRLPSELIDHFHESFSYALYIINNSENSKNRQKSFSRIIDLCKEKKWTEINEDIPVGSLVQKDNQNNSLSTSPKVGSPF